MKSKSELRAESVAAIALFLKRGGVLQEIAPARRKIKHTVNAKASRGFMVGTGGLATGYPRRTIGG